MLAGPGLIKNPLHALTTSPYKLRQQNHDNEFHPCRNHPSSRQESSTCLTDSSKCTTGKCTTDSFCRYADRSETSRYSPVQFVLPPAFMLPALTVNRVNSTMSKRRLSETTWRKLVLCVCTLLTGLCAGFFATYQYSVIRALKLVDDTTYVTIFQAINASVRSAESGVLFFGSIPALLLAIVLHRSERSILLLLMGALISYASTFAITFTVHIPLNEALALVDAVNADAVSSARNAFEIRWNELHLVRTVFATIAFALVVLATGTSAGYSQRR